MSSDFGGEAGEPIEREDLLEYFHSACLSAGGERKLLVGMEHELPPVDPETGEAWPFARGVEEAFLGLLEIDGYSSPEVEGNPTTIFRGAASVNLEPGGQMELSGSPFPTLHEVDAEHTAVLRDFAAVTRARGFTLLSLGLQPVSAAAEIELVPKRRYAILEEYFAAHGEPLYREMMTATASVQANFDFEDEADAGRKMRLAMLAAPVVTALFANSPVERGRETGCLTRRGEIWLQVDGKRTGALPGLLEGSWSFERYVDYALGVPAILVRADDGGVAPAGARPFGDILENGIGGRRATLADWELHLTTIWTVARLKRVMEVRSADTQPLKNSMALPALWTGLLYDRSCLEAALGLVEPCRISWERLNEDAARHGLAARVDHATTLGDLARGLAELSRRGLEARGFGEEKYLDPVDEILGEGKTAAERALEAFRAGGIRGLVEHARI